jgi:DNA processing protein
MDERRGLLDLLILLTDACSRKDKYQLSLRLASEDDFRSWLQTQDMYNYSAIFDKLRGEAEEEDRTARKLGIAWVGAGETGYPPLLRETGAPPSLIFYRGRLPDQGKPLVAMVGTRKPSGAGSAQAYSLAKEFARSGIPVVSGLALGIDAMAHRGALDAWEADRAASPTLAVLGGGLAYITPQSNQGLARRIIGGGGALLSEYPCLMRPAKYTFPERNRIIAGLCRAVVVVEAPERSGALITARDALDAGRDVWVASLGAARSAGCAKLAEDGARVLGGEMKDISALLKDWNYG